MGYRGSQTAELFFDNVEVPIENMIGEEGTCKSIYLYCLDIHFVVRRKIEKVTKLYPQLPTNILFHL